MTTRIPLHAIEDLPEPVREVVLLEAGEDAGDVPLDTPVGAIIFQKV